jgi:hypothetical protein
MSRDCVLRSNEDNCSSTYLQSGNALGKPQTSSGLGVKLGFFLFSENIYIFFLGGGFQTFDSC